MNDITSILKLRSPKEEENKWHNLLAKGNIYFEKNPHKVIYHFIFSDCLRFKRCLEMRLFLKIYDPKYGSLSQTAII
jgi:hypothetical protein